MKRAYRNVKRGGFTLLEITMAIMVMAISLITLWSALVSGILLVNSARNRTQATEDARVVFEEMRRVAGISLAQVTGTNWTTWAATANGGNLTNPALRDDPEPLSNEAVAVSFVNVNADPLEATVTVSWEDKNRARSAAFTTLITRR